MSNSLMRHTLDACHALRHDPASSLYLARAACASSSGVTSEEEFDLRAEAQGAYGNALRVNNRLQEADRALRAARALSAHGTHRRSLTALLEEWTASLYLDLRRFPDATHHAQNALLLRRLDRDVPGVVRTQVLLAAILGQEGHTARARLLLVEAMEQIDPQRQPLVAAAALHNLCWFLVDDGFPSDAILVLEERKAAGFEVPDVFMMQDRWLKARILAAPGGDRELAAMELRDLFREYGRQGRPYDAALCGIELALCLGPAEGLEVLCQIQETFITLGIRRESLATKLLAEALAGGVLRQVLPRLALVLRTTPAGQRRRGEADAEGVDDAPTLLLRSRGLGRQPSEGQP